MVFRRIFPKSVFNVSKDRYVTNCSQVYRKFLKINKTIGFIRVYAIINNLTFNIDTK